MDIKHDIFGTPIPIGATVAFNPPKYKGLILGEVIGFTPKGVRVKYEVHWQKGRFEDTFIYDKDVVVKPIVENSQENR